MWRAVLAASLMLTLAFGAVADAKCLACLESVNIETENGATLLRFTARASDPAAFPETGTAVVMQFDGNRGKCLTVSLVRTGIGPDPNPFSGHLRAVATYVGRFNFIYQGATTLSGRADLGGSIYEFSAPLDGKPGTIAVSSYQGAINGAGAPAIITAPVTITPDPATIDPRLLQTQPPQPQSAVSASQPVADLVNGLTSNVVAVLGLIVVAVVIVSAYFDRKRSLARTTAS